MSIIATLLGWSKLPQWALELIVIGAIAGGLLWYHHHVYETGISAQQHADSIASAKVEAQAAAATQAAQDAANKAQESYHAEVTRNAALAASHPLPAVRLCVNTDSGPGVSEAGASFPGTQSARAPTGSVQRVPAGDHPIRSNEPADIGPMLSALAGRADEVSAELREFQGRQP